MKNSSEDRSHNEACKYLESPPTCCNAFPKINFLFARLHPRILPFALNWSRRLLWLNEMEAGRLRCEKHLCLQTHTTKALLTIIFCPEKLHPSRMMRERARLLCFSATRFISHHHQRAASAFFPSQKHNSSRNYN